MPKDLILSGSSPSISSTSLETDTAVLHATSFEEEMGTQSDWSWGAWRRMAFRAYDAVVGDSGARASVDHLQNTIKTILFPSDEMDQAWQKIILNDQADLKAVFLDLIKRFQEEYSLDAKKDYDRNLRLLVDVRHFNNQLEKIKHQYQQSGFSTGKVLIMASICLGGAAFGAHKLRQQYQAKERRLQQQLNDSVSNAQGLEQQLARSIASEGNLEQQLQVLRAERDEWHQARLLRLASSRQWPVGNGVVALRQEVFASAQRQRGCVLQINLSQEDIRNLNHLFQSVSLNQQEMLRRMVQQFHAQVFNAVQVAQEEEPLVLRMSARPALRLPRGSRRASPGVMVEGSGPGAGIPTRTSLIRQPSVSVPFPVHRVQQDLVRQQQEYLRHGFSKVHPASIGDNVSTKVYDPEVSHPASLNSHLVSQKLQKQMIQSGLAFIKQLSEEKHLVLSYQTYVQIFKGLYDKFADEFERNFKQHYGIADYFSLSSWAKVLNRAVRGDSQHSKERRDFLCGVLCISWAIYQVSRYLGFDARRCSYKVPGNVGIIAFNVMFTYAQFATGVHNPGYLLPGASNSFAYRRDPTTGQSSHYKSDPNQFGIDIRFSGENYPLGLLPFGKPHILFGILNANKVTALFLKFEDAGLGSVQEFAEHSLHFVHSGHVEGVTYREKDIPEKMVSVYETLCKQFELEAKRKPDVSDIWNAFEELKGRVKRVNDRQVLDEMYNNFMDVARENRYDLETLKIRRGNEVILTGSAFNTLQRRFIAERNQFIARGDAAEAAAQPSNEEYKGEGENFRF